MSKLPITVGSVVVDEVPGGIRLGAVLGNHLPDIVERGDVLDLFEALRRYLAITRIGARPSTPPGASDHDGAAPRNYVEETVTYRGSGSDLATDLSEIVPPRKLQDMVDSLVDSGHVRLTLPEPKGPVSRFIDVEALSQLLSEMGGASTLLDAIQRIRALRAAEARIDSVEQAAENLLNVIGAARLAETRFSLMRELVTATEALRTLVTPPAKES